MTNLIRRPAAALALALTLALTVSGCSDDWAKACKDAGGKAQSDREKCGTKTKTTGTGTSKRTKTETKYKTERECIKDGREVTDDDDGICS